MLLAGPHGRAARCAVGRGGAEALSEGRPERLGVLVAETVPGQLVDAEPAGGEDPRHRLEGRLWDRREPGARRAK